MSLVKPTITAVNLLIINEKNEFLIAKRLPHKPMPNKWEFPGGKLESKESLEACGIREIKEELELDVTIQNYIGKENISYKGRDFLIHFFTASLVDISQFFCLKEHSEAKWVSLKAFDDFDFPANKLGLIQRFKETFEEDV
ncbi:(deoxy)nucleoside triphosphate pyrophosphohydrolase [Sulfurimonas sp. MAG313]|nr:(deoxy)nucleoside triphosphate pyrophosphohydrolase [Sulfurimonas sp. MAG313]MDF1881800.1 (deoxy)nucleoside triphosphate pyrophosphohydrolase [Sulfurimonas sp. MAG313]